jgi:hypothetical protein
MIEDENLLRNRPDIEDIGRWELQFFYKPPQTDIELHFCS